MSGLNKQSLSVHTKISAVFAIKQNTALALFTRVNKKFFSGVLLTPRERCGRGRPFLFLAAFLDCQKPGSPARICLIVHNRNFFSFV